MRARTRQYLTAVTVATLILALATLGGYRLRGQSGASHGHARLASTFPQTWLSGAHGTDTNGPTGCQWSPGACSSLNAAYGDTSAGGEITQADPSVDGVLAITKAITLNGLGGKMSVIVGTAAGIAVNAGPSDVVTLRHMEIQGHGAGGFGIVFNGGKQLILDDVTITGFVHDGVHASLTADGSTLTIVNSHIYNNGGAGVSASTSTGTLHVTISHSFIENNTYGIINGDGAALDLSDSVIAANTSIGLGAQTYGNLPSLVHAIHNQLDNNPYAIWEFHGAGNAQIIIWLSDNNIVNNTAGIYGNFGGTLAVFSFGNNRLANNGTNGGVNGTAAQT